MLELPRRNMVEREAETWRPPLLSPGTGSVARVSAAARRFLDVQAGSIWRDMAAILPRVRGKLLDVGCGAQPYRPLLTKDVEYLGIDTADAEAHFGYARPDTRYFSGDVWPVEDGWADVVLATETMEHVPEPAAFLREASRVLKAGGLVVLTVPFAARWHFIPHDYWRYTPSSLARLLGGAGFSNVRVYARGNAVTVACYKTMAIVLSLVLSPARSAPVRVLRVLVGLLCAPLLVPLAVVANVSMLGGGGDDCLGYTVLAGEGRVNVPMEPRACPICGLEDRSVVYAEANVDPEKLGEFAYASRKVPEYMHLRLMECGRCDMLYASPAPPPGTLSAAYNEAAFDSGVEARFAARTYGSFLPGIGKMIPDRVGAVDIGTGDGAFLEELLGAGFSDVVGVEPSAAPIAAAKAEIRPLIRHDIFKAGSFEAGSVSLVTCFQTIEHVPDPLGICREAWRILKPGGVVFLVGHNRRALSAKVLGRKSPIFDIEHLQLFSPRSFRGLLEGAGFGEVGVRPLVSKYPLHYWMKLFPMPGGMKRAAIGASKTARVGFIPIPLMAGNLVAIGRKPVTV